MRTRCIIIFLSWSLLAPAVVRSEVGKPITLPEYVVTDVRELPPAQKWLYAKIDDLEVISSASESTTRHLLRDFIRFRRAMEIVWPDVQRANARLGTLIICGRPGEFRPLALDKSSASPPLAIALPAADRSVIALNYSNSAEALQQVDTSDPNYDPTERRRIPDRYRQLYNTYVRLLISSAQPRAPAWFEEGLAQLFMFMRISQKEVVVGQLHNPNETGDFVGGGIHIQDLDFNAVLRRSGRVSMRELIESTRETDQALISTNDMWQKQAYAFVHWGLYADGGKYQKRFITFLARLAKEPASEDLFKSCFQQSYKEMTMTLLGYGDMTSHRIAGVKAEKGEKLSFDLPFDLREASESEAARINGEALAAAGKIDQAREAMMLPYLRGERDSGLLASLGLLELREGQIPLARKFLESAASTKTTQAPALIALAKIRLSEFLRSEKATTNRLAPEQLASVLTPLFAAREHGPLTPELYATIAQAWTQSKTEPEASHLTVLDEGLTAFPKDFELVYATAVLKARIRSYSEAETLIAHGLKIASEPAQRTRLLALQAALRTP